MPKPRQANRTLWRRLTDPEMRGPAWLRPVKRLISIRAGMLLVYFVVVGGGFFVVMRTLIVEIQPRYLESMEESLVDTANILAAMVEREALQSEYGMEGIRETFERAYRRDFEARIYALEKRKVDLQVYLTDDQGRVLYDSARPENVGNDYSRWRDVALTLQGRYGARATWEDTDASRALLLYVGAPIRVDGRIVGVVTVGKPTTYVNELVYDAERRFSGYAIVAAIAVLALGAILSLWLTVPIQRLIAYASALRDGKPASYPRLFGFEANDLGRAFEEMRIALEGKRYIERYAQSLAHQIKSPLSGISGAAELLEGQMEPEERRRFVGNVRREAERIRRIVDRMLELAALEARRGLEDVEPIALRELAESAATAIQPQFEREGVACEVDVGEDVVVEGERFLLRQALLNLLENALAFSPSGGRVSISAKKNGRVIRLSVLDEGPGIPSYALDKVTDRFYSLVRPKTGSKSSGIGLSFVKEIMSLHEGRLEVANRPEGGTIATLVFELPVGP